MRTRTPTNLSSLNLAITQVRVQTCPFYFPGLVEDGGDKRNVWNLARRVSYGQAQTKERNECLGTMPGDGNDREGKHVPLMCLKGEGMR